LATSRTGAQSPSRIGTQAAHLAGVAELQEEQLAIHQRSTVAAVANAQVTPEGLIADAEAARVKAMAEKGGASAAVSAVIAKAKLTGMWREKPEQTKSGPVIVEVVWPNVN
jgi:hypothetical protein